MRFLCHGRHKVYLRALCYLNGKSVLVAVRAWTSFCLSKKRKAKLA